MRGFRIDTGIWRRKFENLRAGLSLPAREYCVAVRATGCYGVRVTLTLWVWFWA